VDIWVCVKAIAPPDALVDPSDWVKGGGGELIMNRFDEFAVEEALLIREQIPDSRIHVISVGPEKAAPIVRRALGMGADEGIHILTERPGYLCPQTTAAWIAQYAQSRLPDLILTGMMSEDDMNGQVGPLVAELLHWPCATAVIARRFLPQVGRLYVEREVEGGLREALTIQLPAVLAVQSGINQPRYPILSKMLRANHKRLTLIRAETLAPCADQVMLRRTRNPQKTRAGRVLKGTPLDKARQLITILQSRSLMP
jgi:electron transfer flavoprotein beta subunit